MKGLIQFDTVRGTDGKVRVCLWDHICTWGSKFKDGVETRFDEETLSQMILNWRKRGDALPVDYNHQSSYASENGQPAPALAFYNALIAIRDGQSLCFETLDGGVQQPNTAQMTDGLWAYRSEVTELGDKLLPNFKYLSPTFTPMGEDEQGEPIGYMIHAVAATNTPFQSGTRISFTGAIARKKGSTMALKFEEETMKKLGLESGADDEAVKAAYSQKMEEAKNMLADDEEGPGMGHMAEQLEELAKCYEEAFEEEDGPPVVMRKLAKRLSKMASPAAEEAAQPPMMEAETPAEEAAEEEEHKEEENKMEKKLRKEYSAMANRLGVRLPEGSSSRQMFDAISASTVPAAQIPALVEAQVKRQLSEAETARKRNETKARAEVLVNAAVEGGYPKAQRAALLNFASDPKTYDAAEAMVAPFLGGIGESNVLLQKMTSSGAPSGVDPRREGTASVGKDRRVVRNDIATFIVEGEKFSNAAKEMADAKDGPIKMEIDNMLSDSEQAHPGYRLIAANRLLKTKRPDLWAAAEEQDL